VGGPYGNTLRERFRRFSTAPRTALSRHIEGKPLPVPSGVRVLSPSDDLMCYKARDLASPAASRAVMTFRRKLWKSVPSETSQSRR